MLISAHVLAIIIAVLIASSKNRSLVGWFLASLFLSWIAVIIVFLLPAKYSGRRY